MNQNLIDILARYKRLIVIVSVIITLTIIGFIIYKIIYNLPVNTNTTDLSKASQHTIDKAASELTIDIKKMPASVDDQTKAYLDNQLAFILRQKYGAKASDYTATVRQVVGYNEVDALSLYVDVPQANETYSAYINLDNHNGTFVCAPQEQQMDPDTSVCVDSSAGDENAFPNG